MSGIQVGSRLEQLLELERKVKVQIELARREAAAPPLNVCRVEPVATTAEVTSAAPPRAVHVRVLVTQVRPHVIRDWAQAAGLPIAARATLPTRVVQAYAEAHR